jgi:hypothetical protein
LVVLLLLLLEMIVMVLVVVVLMALLREKKKRERWRNKMVLRLVALSSSFVASVSSGEEDGLQLRREGRARSCWSW